MLNLVACMSTSPSSHVLSGMIDMHMRHSRPHGRASEPLLHLDLTSSIKSSQSHREIQDAESKNIPCELSVAFAGYFSISMASKSPFGSSRCAKIRARNANPLRSDFPYEPSIASTISKYVLSQSSSSFPNDLLQRPSLAPLRPPLQPPAPPYPFHQPLPTPTSPKPFLDTPSSTQTRNSPTSCPYALESLLPILRPSIRSV